LSSVPVGLFRGIDNLEIYRSPALLASSQAVLELEQTAEEGLLADLGGCEHADASSL
jgi:hypothetical protein